MFTDSNWGKRQKSRGGKNFGWFLIIFRFIFWSEILESLDVPPDREAESMWEDEIAARVREIDEGKVTLIPWAEARTRITGR
jgi:hypothetical protein